MKSDNRLVTIGGSVTDIVFALGEGDLVVAVDQSSTLPKKVKDLPQVDMLELYQQRVYFLCSQQKY